MPKIRALKPEFFTDDRVVELSPLARLLFQGLWVHACDNGHLEDRPRQLKLRILPADDCDMVALLDEIVAQGMVTRHDGWLVVENLGVHQKADKRYFLRCDYPGCRDTRKPLSTRKVAPPEPDECPPDPLSDHTVTTPGPHRDHAVTTERPSTDGDGDGDGDGDTPASQGGVGGGELLPVPTAVPSTTADAAEPKSRRGTRLPEGWIPARNKANLAAEEGHDGNWLSHELETFRDYWHGIPGAKGVKLDWEGTWRNWIRRSTQQQKTSNGRPKTAASLDQSDWDRWMARAADKDAQHERTAS